ncbi:penicillin amidase [Mucilaginibacter mallensis]|uniref:Penicillin amidase n=1 Tax=Mucilaginibacter mallensis TaxID=652787 RepID=A0A1H1R4H1_MUCMA|nr:penicillin acylase family protein [Mucilaginibacter mallensis]SDS30623.1 penicillin amidase [Mucilaginibacter mallensis]
MRFLKAFLSVVATLVFIWALQTKFGSIPPLGKFLNPATGFWQNAESKHITVNQTLKLPGLLDKVTISYDEHMIPHIFAKNDHDLYYAQGYITAHDRLWQMDIQTRSASGRLAEIVGPGALAHDRYERRMGMVYGAENTISEMMKDPEIKQVITAYTEGVNTYVHQLTIRDYPIEFKLLDYKPEELKPINCAFLLKLMSETLTGGSDQFAMTNNLKHFGVNAVNDLFPDQHFNNEPIIPAGTKWDFKPLPVPKPSKAFEAQMTAGIQPRQKIDGIGSNNWAVNGSKTASGYPILANDPHLTLSFPSIWYQIQLTSPSVNVNGVSLPGAPCIVIGYNQKVSWGVTNVGADVLDWYQIKFKDKSKDEYWYNNRWNKVTRRIEAIKIRGEQTEYDTVIYTHHGPVVYETIAKKDTGVSYNRNVPVGDALRWIAHDTSDDIKTFYLLNHAKNYTDYRAALTYFTAPAQNFIFASVDNDIAITPNGKFPLKYKDQGKFILDGSDPANDWQGWIPASQNPTVKNPSRGFVSSANQSATDASYPYYINWQFGSYYRGKRINDRLTAMHGATVDSMRLMQMDNYSILAQDVLPTMIKYLDPTKMDAAQLKAVELLKKWDKRYDANAIGATVFDAWWQHFYNLIWADKFYIKGEYFQPPYNDRTERLLLTEPNSKWFDNAKTQATETCTDVVNRAFYDAIDELTTKNGPQGEKWEWGYIKQTYISHTASLPGFGTGNFVAGGTSGVINALKGDNGPSWRMVVQLGPQVKGYGILPTGESGNPGSYYYDDMLPIWKSGQLSELLFMQKPGDGKGRIKKTVVLEKKD